MKETTIITMGTLITIAVMVVEMEAADMAVVTTAITTIGIIRTTTRIIQIITTTRITITMMNQSQPLTNYSRMKVEIQD